MILAIDPGLSSVGWAVVSPGTGRVVDLGTIVTKPDASLRKSTDRARRAHAIAYALRGSAIQHGCTVIAAEAVSIAGGPARFSMATSLGLAWGVIAALTTALGAALYEVTPKEWQHAIAPETTGAIDYPAIEAKLTAFVRDHAAARLVAIRKSQRNHAIDAVAIGLFVALRPLEATRIVAGVRQVPGDDARMLVLRDALIEGRTAEANALIASIAADQRARDDRAKGAA
jgi:Holliday junction resolvasome RuvABC endonuclease subunit